MSRIISDSKPRLDIYGDFRKMESLSSELKLLLNPFLNSRDVKKDGIKHRYIIEVTGENIDYCKELMKILELRHLDNLKGNFVLYEDKYIFLYENDITGNNGDSEENKTQKKNYDLKIGNEFRNEIVKQQQGFFDTFWNNSLPADIKVAEIENREKEHPLKNIIYNNFVDLVRSSQHDNYVIDMKNTLTIIRNQQDIEDILLSDVYSARSEVLLTVRSLDYLNHLWNIGMGESLKHAISQGAKIIILYPEINNNEIFDKNVALLFSSIIENVQLEGIEGTMGSVLIIDSSKILLSSSEKDEAKYEDEHKRKSHNADVIGVYSNNKSIVNNYGALFDTLLNEKETVRYVSKVKEQLENSNNQLIESNQKLNLNSELQHEFINLAAHELRTPTQAIIGYGEMIEEHPDKSSDNQNYLKAIVRNANRLGKLVEDLLNVARIESNNMVLDKEKTSLEDLINTVVQDFRIHLEKEKKTKDKEIDSKNDKKPLIKDIQITTSLNTNDSGNKDYQGGFEVTVDRSKIVQAISNIINNSLNSISSNRKNRETNVDRIHITLSKIVNNGQGKTNGTISSKQEKANEVIVSIKDTGKGIDLEIFPRLFTKFATNSSSGTGLGLYLTKSIVEAHGGKIWAENNQNKMGATFRFTLPVA